MTSQGWLFYTYSIQFSVQLHIQSLLWVILHVQLIIIVSVIVLSLGSISTWYQSLCRLISLLPICIAGSTSLTRSTFYWLKGTIAEIWPNLKWSSWIHSISSNGKMRWRYYWERKDSTRLPWKLRQIPMQLHRNLNGTTGGMRPMVFCVWVFQETFHLDSLTSPNEVWENLEDILERQMRWEDKRSRMNWSPWVPVALNHCNSILPSLRPLFCS